jgi:hypothetical protein
MSKYDIRRYLFDTDTVESDLFILLAVFHSSLNNHQKLEPLFKAKKILGYSIIEEQLIQKTLISTAILLRMIDDRFKTNNKSSQPHYLSVGQLIANKKTIQLSFREACNKIVHANDFTLNKIKSNKTKYLDNYIIVKGSKGRERWTAKIEIEKYVVDGLCLTKFYDEDWDISSR